MSGFKNTACLVALVLAMQLRPCTADPTQASTGTKRPSPTWVERVARAAERGDQSTLGALANDSTLDPWLAVDALHATESFEAAEAYVAHIDTPKAPRLKAYASETRMASAPLRSRIARARELLSSSDKLNVAGDLLKSTRGAAALPRVEAIQLRGVIAEARGEAEEAAGHFRTAAAQARALGWTRGEVKALRSLFLSRVAAGQVEEPLELLDRLVTAGAELRDPRVAHGARIWKGGVLLQAGRAAEALEQLQAVLLTIKGGELPNLRGEAHATLAQALNFRGDYSLALHHSTLSGEIFERTKYLEGALYARASAISTYVGLGLDRFARDLCRQQLDRIGESTQYADYQSEAILALAVTEARLGNEKASKAAFARALAQAERAKDVATAGTIRLNRGSVLHEGLGERDAARQDYAAVIAMDGIPQRIRGYALVYIARRRDARSDMATLQKAHEIAERVQDRALLVLTLAATSQRHLELAQKDAAWRTAREAMKHALRASAAHGSEEAANLMGRDGPRRAAAAYLAAAMAKGSPDALFDALEASRANALLSALGGGSRVRKVAAPHELERRLREAKVQYADRDRAYLLSKRRGQPLTVQAAKRRAVDDAKAVVAGLDARLVSERRRADRMARPTPVRLADLHHHLGASEAFVHLFNTDGRVRALVVQRGGASVRAVELPPDLHERLEEIADPDSRVSHRGDGLPAVLHALGSKVRASLRLHEEIRQLSVVPSPELVNVPWPLLSKALGVQRVALVPSATILTHIDHAPLDMELPRLAVGVRDYSLAVEGVARRIHARGVKLPNLPMAVSEVRSTARAGDSLLTDAAATEEAVRRSLGAAAPQRSIVHFACHGIVRPEHPELSALALIPGAGSDGFLSVAEVPSLHLRTGLAVLSACDVGASHVRAGQGPVGLPGAFLVTGASRVLANLWKVSDEAGHAFMQHFYKRLNETADPTEALAYAQRKLPEENSAWRHPYYWAGWVLWGTPR